MSVKKRNPSLILSGSKKVIGLRAILDLMEVKTALSLSLMRAVR
jgi:hypothetical protein